MRLGGWTVIWFFAALSLNCIVYFYADLRLASLFSGRSSKGKIPGCANFRKGLKSPRRYSTASTALDLEPHTTYFFSWPLAGALVISISTALVDKLSPTELKIVLAFEIHRLKNRTTASATAVSALVGFITLIASALDENCLTAISDTLVSPLARTTRTIPEARRSSHGSLHAPDFAARRTDHSPIDLATLSSGGRQGSYGTCEVPSSDVARTLWKLDSFAKTRPFPVNLAEAHLFMVSPLARYPFWRFASAQPPTSARLKNLTGHTPL